MNIRKTWPVAGFVLIALQAVAGESLPRVFFTPQERADIVQRRSLVARGTPAGTVTAPGTVAVATADGGAASPDMVPVTVTVAPRVLRLQGVTVASSGATFAWIDGQRYANGARVAGHRLDISAQGVVIVDASGRKRRIRVGETLDGAAQRVDATLDGAVRTAAARP